MIKRTTDFLIGLLFLIEIVLLIYSIWFGFTELLIKTMITMVIVIFTLIFIGDANRY